MLLSIAYVLLFGMFSGWICKKLNLPSLLGMIITGILVGPHVFNLLDNSILDISSELRRIALIIILMRAGLSLDLNDLKRVGRPAILMCFLPATVEIIGMVILAPKLLGISVIDAAIMGSVVAAVSPAVIVPKMLKLMEEGYGKKNSIPQLILAGASVDDVFVIVLFSVFTSLAQGGSVSITSFATIPVAIILGIIVGAILGIILNQFFMKIRIRDTAKTVILLSISFILVTIEDNLNIPFSALISIMSIGITMQKQREIMASRLASKFNKLWVPAEIVLFVMVGASVDIKYALSAGVAAIFLILGVMIFRMCGVYLALLKTHLGLKERLFCMIAYTPKATVQAAIGGIPLQMGLACGNIVLTVAVLSILITAPLGAFFVDMTYKKLLKQGNN